MIAALDRRAEKGFNPRPRAGGDAPILFRTFSKNTVSIHAPVRGATIRSSRSDPYSSVSIHAPVRGAT